MLTVSISQMRKREVVEKEEKEGTGGGRGIQREDRQVCENVLNVTNDFI